MQQTDFAHLTRVRYIGSLVDAHGEWMVDERCWCKECEDCGPRWVLGRIGSTQRLMCVKADSFARID